MPSTMDTLTFPLFKVKRGGASAAKVMVESETVAQTIGRRIRMTLTEFLMKWQAWSRVEPISRLMIHIFRCGTAVVCEAHLGEV